MSNDKVKRANFIIAGASALVVVAFGILCPMLTATSINSHITAKADAVYKQCQTAYDDYGAALQGRLDRLEAEAKANEGIGVVIPNSHGTETDFESVRQAAEDSGLNPDCVMQDTDGAYVYIIQPGDTLTDISRAFGYSVDQLANFNEIRNVNLIYAKSSLRIPHK